MEALVDVAVVLQVVTHPLVQVEVKAVAECPYNISMELQQIMEVCSREDLGQFVVRIAVGAGEEGEGDSMVEPLVSVIRQVLVDPVMRLLSVY